MTKSHKSSEASVTFGYVDVSVDPLSALELGVLAEKSGFSHLWVPDHFTDVDGDKIDSWTTLSAVAVKTKRILLGSGVTDTQRNHPARTAHMVACLDSLSRGRAVLGIGAGEAMNVVPFGLPWGSSEERVVRLSEAIRVIRSLWSSSRQRTVSFDGRFFRLEKAFLSQAPVRKPSPPIYVGAFASRRALRVVGEHGDGWYAWLNTPATFKRRWSIIAEAARSAGRDPGRIHPASHLMVAFPKNSQERKDALLAVKVTLLVERSILASMNYQLDPDLLQYQKLSVEPDSVRVLMREAESIPDENVYRTTAIGGMSEANLLIEELSKAGVEHFAVVDVLAPRTAIRTMGMFQKIIREQA